MTRVEGLVRVTFTGQQPSRIGATKTQVHTADQTEPNNVSSITFVRDLGEYQTNQLRGQLKQFSFHNSGGNANIVKLRLSTFGSSSSTDRPIPHSGIEGDVYLPTQRSRTRPVPYYLTSDYMHIYNTQVRLTNLVSLMEG